jgi:hypothetical protein
MEAIMPVVFSAESPPLPNSPRRRRKAASPPLVLGKTKRTILLLLARHLFLRADQICAIAFGKSLPFIRMHLRELSAAGWILHAPYLRDSDLGKAPHIYTLHTPGWEWVQQLGVPIPLRFRPSEEIGKPSPHTMAISEFGVALERFCRTHPLVQIAQYRHERVLPYAKVSLPNGTTRRVRPDAWVQLAIQRPEGMKQRAFVYEADRQSEYQTDFREKIRALLFYRREAYRQLFATESIAFLFTVPSAHRRNLVRAYIEAEIAEHEKLVGKKVRPDLFWITDADPRALDTALFTEPVWVHPFASNAVALLDTELPAPGAREDAFNAAFLGAHGMLRFYQNINERPPVTSLETDIDEVI